MANGMVRFLGVLIGAAIVGLTPGAAMAAKSHTFVCNDCHRAAANPNPKVTLNFCVGCHTGATANPIDKFTAGDASHAMGNNSAKVDETSHFWGGSSTLNPAAGSTHPATTFYTSRYGVSTGRVTCSICHDPHVDEAVKPKLLRASTADDLLCQQCHGSWYVANADALLTHPIVANYATIAAANPTKFKAFTADANGRLSTNVASGDVRLVSGKVSCTSCHGTHYTDSSSSTADGTLNYNSLVAGDGKILRTDGPKSLVGGAYSDANAAAQAQLRSNLCQSCHTYKAHGKTADGGAQIGCLDCHGGHAYNNGTPNIFILSRNVNTYAPINGGTTLTSLDLMSGIAGKYNAPYSKTTNDIWSDRAAGTANGYCEKCHGDVQSAPILSKATAGHGAASNEACTNCHHHDGTGWTHSFQPDVSAASCGDCHGFPPYLNAAGNRTSGGTDGGYAYSDVENSTVFAPLGTKWNYSSHSGAFKDETQTAHNTHAGGSTTFPNYYFVGASGTENCEVCHGDSAGFDSRHRDVTRQASFRDVPFNTFASANGALSPAYLTSAPWTCNNIYCHTNGGPKDNAGVKTYQTHVTPAWDQANGGGKDALFASGTRCSSCHGNDAATMATGQKNASQAHIKHLSKGYTCNVCHSATATSNTVLKAGATRGNLGGKHVDGTADVAFDTTYNLGAATLSVGGTPYTAANGTCSVYCHSDGLVTNVTTVDWQVAATGSNASCTACHKGNVASGSAMTSGSHGQHINGTVATIGRQMGCVECHSNTVSNDTTVSNAANHVNGLYTLGMQADTNKTSCSNIKCHSNGNLDGTITYKASGVDFIWGSNGTIGCDDCHGDGAGIAYPIYANGGIGNNSNSHAPHGNIACGECHASVSTNGTAIDGTTPANHVNQTIEVGGAKFTWTGGTETCSAITCHGGGTAQWGATSLACGSCHQNATADTDDFTFGNGTQSVIATNEWSFSGHGKTTGTYEVTGRSAANFPGAAPTGDPCKFCHDGGVTHNASNYFRLRQNGEADLNGVCLGCHKTGSTGVDPDGAGTAYNSKNATVKVDKYHQGAKHGDPRDGGRWCWDCHDPHGDASAAGSRIQMIQKRAQVNPNAYGVPASLTSTDIVFTSRTTGAGAGGFARDSAPYAAGLCNACHTTTTQYTAALGANGHATGQCTTCHEHSKDSTYNGIAFQGSGCNGCHGNSGTGQYWPDGVGGSPAYVDNSAGSATTHGSHIKAIGVYLGYGDWNTTMYSDAQQKTICAFCHPNPGGTGHSTDSGDQVVDLLGAGQFTKFTGVGATAVDSGSGAYSAGSCATLACHNGVATPASWNTPPAANCTTLCHGPNTTATAREGHQKHVVVKGYACTECHVNNGTNYGHINGEVNLVFTNAGSIEQTYGAGNGSYSQAANSVPRDGVYGNCGNMACHADKASPNWDATITATGCLDCHTLGGASMNPNSGLHTGATPTVSGAKHDNTLTGGCAACHTVSALATHVNGLFTGNGSVAGDRTNMGLIAGFTTSGVDNTGTCAGGTVGGAGCHVGGDAGTWARKWDSSIHYLSDGTQCKGCHGGFGGTDWTFGSVSNTTDGSVEHNRNWDGDANTSEVIGNHKDNNGNTTRCNICHVYADAPYTTGAFATYHRNGSIEMNSSMAYNSTTWDCASSCHSNNTNHNLEDSGWTVANVAGPALSCYTCHGNGSTQYWPGGASYPNRAGEHQAHITAIAAKLAITLPGTDLEQKRMCAYCHNDATGVGGVGHDVAASPADVGSFNPIWDITNPPSVADDGTESAGACSNIDCHNNKATTPTYDWYAGAATACAMCHTNGASDTTHTAHLTGTYGKTIDCLSCHGAGTTSTTAPTAGHINGTLAVAGSVTFTYSGGLTGTCGTNNCHNDGNGGTPYSSGTALGAYNWGTALTNCTACHNNPNSTGNGGARHTKHMANTTYVPGGCNECHPAATVATHIDGTKNATGTKQTLYTSANGTCTNSCHTATLANGVWTDALALPCVNCHQSGTYVGSGANLPASGLHNVTVALKHDATLQSGNCINCHSSAPTSVATNHINGTLQNATAITYAWNANVVSYVPATGCQAAVACHTDGGDWRRKWAGVVDAKPLATNNPGDAVCGNCHGDYGTGWRWNEANASTTDHTDPNGDLTDQMSTNHGTCLNCHGWGNGAYDKTWSTGKHGDGLITMNGPTGTGSGYTDGTGGCAQSCHGDIAGRRMNSNSGWTANYGDYGAGSCFSCHGNGTNEYWPSGAVYPNKAGRHTLHITRIAAKLGITLPGTDLEQKRMCAYCHNDAAGVGGSGHNTDSVPTGVADVGAINPIWDATNPPSVTDTGAAFNTTDGSCASIDCHNNKTLAAGTFGWRDASTTACTMCHTPGGATNDPTSGLHNVTPTVSGQRHDNTITGGCAACHTTIPTPGSGTHINGAFTGNGTVAGDKTNMGLFAAYTATADGTGSCLGTPTGNAGCHSGAGDAGTWARKWDSTISGQSNGTECKGCHGGFAKTDWTFGSTHNTTDGSTEHNYSWDADGTVEIVGNHKDDLANTSRCNVCHVYGDTGYVFGTNHRNGSLEMNSTRGYSDVSFNCTSTCHINNTNHNLEDSGWTIAPVAGPALACDSCHGGSGNYWPNMASTAAGDYPNRKGRHDIHMTRLAAKLGYTLPGTDLQQKAMCDYCHNDATGSGGTGHDDRVAPANLGGFNHIGNAAADANGTYTSTAPGTCTTVDCHNNKLTTSGTYGWYDSGTSACLMCHTLGGATNDPTSGLHNIIPTVSGQAMGQHDDSFGTGGTNTCTNCHASLPAMATTSTHINGTFTGNGTLAGDKTNMGLFAAYTATADNIGTCSGALVGGASCHAGAGDAGSWARVWNSTVSNQTNGTECKGCHGGFAGTDWTWSQSTAIANNTRHGFNWDGDANTSEVIGNHKDNVANTTRCSTCHVYADAPYTTGAFATYHRDGKIEMNSSVEYQTATFNCTGACHAANNANHNLEASGWTVQAVAGPALACSSCHGGGTAQAGGTFNYWPDGTVYPDAANGGRHLTHVTKIAAKLGYTMGSLTDAQQKQICSYCHDNVGGVGHNDATQPADTNFHPLWDATNPASVVDSGAAWSNVDNSCSSIDCHNNKLLNGTFTWNGAGTSTCLMCHTAGGATNDPISGLHSIVPTTTGQTHDDTFATGGTCTSCHTTMPALAVGSSHMNGTFTGNGTIAGDKTAMGLFAAYTGTSTANNGSGTCSGALVGGASCHANIMDAGSWARLWDSSVPSQTNGTECKGCHGGFAGNDWTWDQTTVVAGNTRHDFSWDGDGTKEIIGNHKANTSNTDRCNICHVYGDTGYVWGTNHRNGKITMNTQTSYNTTSFNCTAVCHVNNTGHNLEAASTQNWATRGETVAGPALACYTCHGGGTANSGSGFNYWPDGTAYPDNAGGSGTNRHLAHITKLAAKLNYTMATLTDQQQKTMCAYCHPYTTNPGEANHNDNVSPADVTAAGFNPLWSALTANYPSTADGGTAAAWNTGTQQCSGIDCHNNQATTGTWAWNSTSTIANSGTGACLLCHNLGGTGNNPTSGLHRIVPTVTGAAGTHDDSFGTGGTCTSCHTSLPVMAAASTHPNGTFTANSTIAGDRTAMGIFSAYTQSANDVGTCSGAGVASAGCHGDGVAAAQKGDAGTWKRVWNNTVSNQTNGTECKGCHGGFASDWTFGSATVNTGDTSTDHQGDYDTVGGAQLIGNHSGATQTSACVNCHVYGEGNYVWATNHRNGAIEVNSTLGMTTGNRTCTTNCHTNANAHVLDASGWTVSTLAGAPLSCQTCHAAITTHVDADGSTGTTYPTGGGGTSAQCLDCHTDHNVSSRTGTNAANNVYIKTTYGASIPIPTLNKQYSSTSHNGWIQLGGVATDDAGSFSTEAEMCWGCHENTGATKRVATTITFTATTIVDSGNGLGIFSAGDLVIVSGSSQAGNNKLVKITSVAAGTLTFPAATFTADATAGESVTIKRPVSEWQSNNDAATGSSTYDYGTLFSDASTVPGTFSSNWTTGYWRSGKGLTSTLTTDPFWYKRGKIRSTHSANYDGTTVASGSDGTSWKAALSDTATAYSKNYNKNEALDVVGNIRCTYCHDVHGTHDNGTTDTGGAPYLRGKWVGNLYSEDGAPRYGMSTFTVQGDTTTSTQYGAVPRASANPANTGLSGVAKVGGWWIDQNHGNPTSGITGATALDKANSSSGLCEMCHGANKTGIWTAAAIGTLDQVTGEALWVSGGNGHANAVIGAPGASTTAANIFNRTNRGSAAVDGLAANTGKDAVDMGLATQTGYGTAYRQSTSETSGYRWLPMVANSTEAGATSSRAYAYRYFAWNTTNYQTAATYPRNYNIAAGTTELQVTNEPELATETAHNSQPNYHTFTCSKCHNPHASRLPKLMITNCLDTNHNTWEDKNTFTQQQTGSPAMGTPWSGLRHSQWASAQNCHRLDARATNTGVTTVGPGWNKVTPWIEDTTPNPASGSGKTADITTQIAY